MSNATSVQKLSIKCAGKNGSKCGSWPPVTKLCLIPWATKSMKMQIIHTHCYISWILREARLVARPNVIWASLVAWKKSRGEEKSPFCEEHGVDVHQWRVRRGSVQLEDGVGYQDMSAVVRFNGYVKWIWKTNCHKGNFRRTYARSEHLSKGTKIAGGKSTKCW